MINYNTYLKNKKNITNYNIMKQYLINYETLKTTNKNILILYTYKLKNNTIIYTYKEYII